MKSRILYFWDKCENKNYFKFSMSKKIKLQPRLRRLAYNEKIVPELKISGVWLEEIGFKAGSIVNITIREELLIIQPIKTNR